MRKLIAGTGWKMNNGVAETQRYAKELSEWLVERDLPPIEIFVLPPFTSLHAAAQGFSGTPVRTGGQNMHWEDCGGWTGEVSAPMLREAGCSYVELAHSERLQHFGENYASVGLKVAKAMSAGLTPIICLGETASEKHSGNADQVLADQVLASLDGVGHDRIHETILAYEPRWAIGAAEAAAPEYVAEKHAALRAILCHNYGESTADRTRIIYGGSVTAENGRAIIRLADVDGLFVGRAAWKADGFAKIIETVAEAAREKQSRASASH